jgi:hypothetical protein
MPWRGTSPPAPGCSGYGLWIELPMGFDMDFARLEQELRTVTSLDATR